MAWVFIRLKLALVRHQYGGGRDTLGAVVYTLMWLAALGIGLAILLLFVGGVSSSRLNYPLVTEIAYLGAFTSAAITPIVLAGNTDPVLSMDRFDLLPLTSWEKVRGFLAASLVGPAPLLGFLLGLVVFGSGPASVLTGALALISAVLLVVQCAAASKLIGELLSGVVSTRRGRELAALISGLLLIGIWLLSQASNSYLPQLLRAADNGDLGWLSYTPIGSTALIVSDVTAGRPWIALLRVGYAVATILAVLAIWASVLKMRLKGGGQTTARAGNGVNSALYPRLLRALPHSVSAAAAAQMTRYYFFRNSQGTRGIVSACISSAIVSFMIVNSDPTATTALLAVTASTLLTIVPLTSNVFGYENGGFSTYLLTGADLGRVLSGKLLPAVFVVVPIVVAVTGFATFRGAPWVCIPVGLALALGLTPLFSAVGALTSVLSPFDVTNRAGSNQARAMVSVLASLGTALVLAVVLAGLGFLAIGITGLPAPIALLLLLALSLTTAHFILRAARHQARTHASKILHTLSPTV